MTTTVVLAYSGEADVAEAVRRLTAAQAAEVATLTVGVGLRQNLGELRDRALAAGAARAHVLDVREEFVRDFLLPGLQAGIAQSGWSLFAGALGQALLAGKLIEIAAVEGTRSVAHLETEDGKRRLEANLKAIDGTIGVTAVASGRPHDVSATATSTSAPSATSSSRSAKTVATPAAVDVSFDRGMPVAVNGVQMTLVELVESLLIIGEKHGVGPGILDVALRALEAATVSPELVRKRDAQATAYSELVLDGRWFTEARAQLDAFNARMQQMVTGTVRVNLFEGRLLSSSVIEGDAAVSR